MITTKLVTTTYYCYIQMNHRIKNLNEKKIKKKEEAKNKKTLPHDLKMFP